MRRARGARVVSASGDPKGKPVRARWEHVFVEDNPNVKGNVAEAAVALEATKLGLEVYRPLTEHGRADMVLGIGGQLFSVQCKWGALSREDAVICVRLASRRHTPAG